MEKKRIALGLFVIVMLSISIFLFLDSKGTITGSAIGASPKEGTEFYFIVLIGQIFLMAIILIMANLEGKESSTEIKSLTDIDIFYIMLQKNKLLKLNTVSKAFNISKDLALEWAKILEEHNMAKIRYHTFMDTDIVSMDYDDFIKKQKELQKIKTASKVVGKVNAPVAAAVVQKPAPPVTKEKGYKTLAALLSLFFGFLGADRFYLGYIKSGILKLLVFAGAGAWIYTDWFYFKHEPLNTINIIILSIVSVWLLVDFLFVLTGVLKPKMKKNGKK